MASDTGDMWRERRDARQKARRYWPECPTCGRLYGQGTKVPPGETCHRCGWEAPDEG